MKIAMYSPLSKSLSDKISAASFIAACLVVFIHVPHDFDAGGFGSVAQCFIVEGIARIAVPFFFAVSGFFLARHIDQPHWYRTEVGKRVKSILVPYFVWCLIYIIPGYALTLIANVVHHAPIGRNIHSVDVVSVFGLSPIVDPQSAQLWYLRFLFVLVLASPVFVWVLRAGFKWCMVLLAFLFVGNCILPGSIPRSDLHTFFRHAFVFNGFFYFFLGMMISRFDSLGRISIPRFGLIAIGGIGIGLYGLNCYLYRAGGLLLISVNSTIANLMVLCAFWMLMKSPALPKWLRGMSFPLYLIHYIVICLVGSVLGLLGVKYNCANFITYLSMSLLVITISIVIAHLLRRFKGLYSLLTGGRIQ